MSHLWASVDHESASREPAIRWRIDGTPAAQIPNAPSIWTQAPLAWAIGMSSSNGSNAPLFTLPGLHADDDRAVEPGERLAQGVGPHPPLLVGGDLADALALAPEAEHLEGGVDRDVRPAVGDDRHRRRTLETLSLDVPAGPGEDAVPRRGQRREVGHRRAGHEPDARPGRQAEQVDQPGSRHFLGDRGGRRQGVQAAVLVPGTGQPVGTERGRQAATDDEPEVAPARAGDQARVGRGGQVLDHRERVRRMPRGADASPIAGPQRRQVDRAADGAGRQRREVVGRDAGSFGR